MVLIEVIQPIIMMAIIVGIGFIISKKVEITKQTRQFISFTVLNVAIPSVIIQSILQTEIEQKMWGHFGIIFICGLILNFSGLILGYIAGRIFKYSELESKQKAILSGFGNTGFFGIPIAHMLFGPTSGIYASIYDAVTVLTVFTVGIMLLQDGRFSLVNFKHMINAPFVTLVITLIVAYNKISVPALIVDLSAILSSLAAPLAMIYIGMLFQEITAEKWIKVKEGYLSFMFSSSIIKIFILPLIAFTILYFSPIESSIGKVILLQAGMPTFLLATILFEQYTDSEDLGIVNIIITSTFSLLSLPIIIYISMY